MATIQQRRGKLAEKIRKNKAERIRLDGELKALQSECDHPNASSFLSGDYSSARFMAWSCPDCGLSEER